MSVSSVSHSETAQATYRQFLQDVLRALKGFFLESEHGLISLRVGQITTVSADGGWCSYIESCELGAVGIEGLVVEVDELS